MGIIKPKDVPILEEDNFEEDYYDSKGRCTPGGMYDAGGHLITDRYIDYMDYLYDKMRDEGM